jgi:hypothetical protein
VTGSNSLAVEPNTNGLNIWTPLHRLLVFGGAIVCSVVVFLNGRFRGAKLLTRLNWQGSSSCPAYAQHSGQCFCILLELSSDDIEGFTKEPIQSRGKMTTVKKIVVCGGNGFLGSRICKSAVARGWDVTSVR